MSEKVKVLCINGSPRGRKSDSEKMLQLMAKHVREFGAEVQMLYLIEKKIIQCEGCYSKTRDGSKCVYPCIHKGKDDTAEVLEMIISCHALAIATPVYWGSVPAFVHGLIEKMTAIENNRSEIEKRIGKDPVMGKPVALLASQEGEGSSMALSQLMWGLSHMGFLLPPWGMIFKPAILNRSLVRVGLKIMRERKFEWIENTIRLAARNLANLPILLENFSFDDYKFLEPRC